jgi:hypothetical protein
MSRSVWWRRSPRKGYWHLYDLRENLRKELQELEKRAGIFDESQRLANFSGPLPPRC